MIEIQCYKCGTWNDVPDHEIGEISLFVMGKQKIACSKCGALEYDAHSTRSKSE